MKSRLLVLTIAIAGAVLPWRVDAADQFAKANGLMSQRKYALAVTELNGILKSAKPGSASYIHAYCLMATCYYSFGQIADAEKLYGTVASTSPTSADGKYARDMLQRMGKPVPTAGATAGSGTEAPPSADAIVAAAKALMEGSSVKEGADRKSHLPQGYVFDEQGNGAVDSPYDKLPDQTRIYYQDGPQGHMIVKGYVNDHPIDMWFDTGATAFFSKGALQAAGVAVPTGEPTGYTSGWAGKRVPTWCINADVRLGGISRRLPVVIEESSSLMPLIGTDLTRGYEIEIDSVGHCMNLKRTASGGKAEVKDSLYDIPCRTKGHDVFVNMSIGGRPCEVFIDTGAAATILSPEAAQRLHLDIPADAPELMMGGVGGSISVRKVFLDMRLGPVHREGFPVLIGGRSGNCIGQDFMSGWRFKVDRDNHMVRFFH
jgi:predicted aspartyl protease